MGEYAGVVMRCDEHEPKKLHAVFVVVSWGPVRIVIYCDPMRLSRMSHLVKKTWTDDADVPRVRANFVER